MKASKVIKSIKIEPENCTGCRSCEVCCSAYHADPKYTYVNPFKSRIRIFRNELQNIYLPIISGQYAEKECDVRCKVVINGKDYEECNFCRVACPARNLFLDPDTGSPLLCDCCGDPVPEGGPLCVQACHREALVYLPERVEEEEATQELAQNK